MMSQQKSVFLLSPPSMVLQVYLPYNLHLYIYFSLNVLLSGLRFAGVLRQFPGAYLISSQPGLEEKSSTHTTVQCTPSQSQAFEIVDF